MRTLLTISIAAAGISCGHLALGIGEDLDCLGDFPGPNYELPHNGLLADNVPLLDDPPKIMPHDASIAFKMACARQGKSWISVLKRCERLPK
jgi:hypothetical protein